MIYLSFNRCEKDHLSQHNTAYKSLDKMMKVLYGSNYTVSKEANGRPSCDAEGIDFSISHCQNVALTAVLTDTDKNIEDTVLIPLEGSKIGIDIEKIDSTKSLSELNKISQRFLSCDVSSREEFYKKWTQHEAYGKMTGEGVLFDTAFPCSLMSFTVEFENSTYYMSIAVK